MDKVRLIGVAYAEPKHDPDGTYNGLMMTTAELKRACGGVRGKKVYIEHSTEGRKPVGEVTDAAVEPTGRMVVELTIDRSTVAGASVVRGAREGKYGLSVGQSYGVDPRDMRVLEKNIDEVSLVSQPDLDGSDILRVEDDSAEFIEMKKRLLSSVSRILRADTEKQREELRPPRTAGYFGIRPDTDRPGDPTGTPKNTDDPGAHEARRHPSADQPRDTLGRFQSPVMSSAAIAADPAAAAAAGAGGSDRMVTEAPSGKDLQQQQTAGSKRDFEGVESVDLSSKQYETMAKRLREMEAREKEIAKRALEAEEAIKKKDMELQAYASLGSAEQLKAKQEFERRLQREALEKMRPAASDFISQIVEHIRANMTGDPVADAKAIKEIERVQNAVEASCAADVDPSEPAPLLRVLSVAHAATKTSLKKKEEEFQQQAKKVSELEAALAKYEAGRKIEEQRANVSAEVQKRSASAAPSTFGILPAATPSSSSSSSAAAAAAGPSPYVFSAPAVRAPIIDGNTTFRNPSAAFSSQADASIPHADIWNMVCGNFGRK